MFDTKVVLIVRADLAVWQKLNVVAFTATGIAAAAPEALGEIYEDATGHRYERILGQPMLVFSADLAELQTAHRKALLQEITIVPYVHAMFSTGHDVANREVFRADDAAALDLVGMALYGPKKRVDKAVKGLNLHM